MRLFWAWWFDGHVGFCFLHAVPALCCVLLLLRQSNLLSVWIDAHHVFSPMPTSLKNNLFLPILWQPRVRSPVHVYGALIHFYMVPLSWNNDFSLPVPRQLEVGSFVYLDETTQFSLHGALFSEESFLFTDTVTTRSKIFFGIAAYSLQMIWRTLPMWNWE